MNLYFDVSKLGGFLGRLVTNFEFLFEPATARRKPYLSYFSSKINQRDFQQLHVACAFRIWCAAAAAAPVVRLGKATSAVLCRPPAMVLKKNFVNWIYFVPLQCNSKLIHYDCNKTNH